MRRVRTGKLQGAEPTPQDLGLVTNSLLFAAMEDRLRGINEHKWYESEREGYDIGFDRALLDWLFKHSRPLKATP